MLMTGARAIVECLRERGVDLIFGYPGGMILPLYDALVDEKEIKQVLVTHEQNAAHAADGYARATGKVGVCMATSGPGATNLVTGIATDRAGRHGFTRSRRLSRDGHTRQHHARHETQLQGQGGSSSCRDDSAGV